MNTSINADQPKRPRVLMLIENESYPWDRRMRLQAQTLRQAGYHVSVICPKGEGFERKTYEVVDAVTVYRYPAIQASKGAFGYLIEYSWAFFCSFVLCCLVWAIDGIDVIHAANPPDCFFPLARLFKLFGKKFVFDEHDLCPELYDSKFGRQDSAYRALMFFEKQSYAAADLVISTNESYRRIAQERGRLPDARVAVVRNAPPECFSRTDPRTELKEGFPHLLVYLGVMGKQDGVDRVVRAAHHLIRDHARRDVLFVLIGKGECWQALQNLSRELDIEKYLRFPGRVSDELLLQYLSTADVGLAPDPPDRMNQLSTMTKIVEYMACELPIVSFDLLESRRSAGDAAVYVEKDDPQLFAAAINDLLNDPARRERMGRIGRERVHEFVGWRHSGKALLEAYSRLDKSVTSSLPSPFVERL